MWDYANEGKTPPKDLSLPQLSPHASLAKPTWDQSGTKKALKDDADEKAHFLSPLYDRLETNIPRALMGFSDLDWPQDAQLFPKHETVTQYIEDYSQDVKHIISFQTQVLDVRLAESSDDCHPKWNVKTQEVKSDSKGSVAEQTYDAVIVASGHFAVPYIPDIKGMKAWSDKYPGVVTHSMYYQKPEQYTDKVRSS